MRMESIFIVLTVIALAVVPYTPAAAESPSDAPYIDEGRIVRSDAETDMQSPGLKAYDSSVKNFIIRWPSPGVVPLFTVTSQVCVAGEYW